jgi:hypothetical protein
MTTSHPLDGGLVKVEELGHRLGDILDQEAVGLETGGQYKSITMD